MADLTIQASPYFLGQWQDGVGGGFGATAGVQFDNVKWLRLGNWQFAPRGYVGGQGLWRGETVLTSEEVVVMGCPDDSASSMTGDCQEITETVTTSSTQTKPTGQFVWGAGVMADIDGSPINPGLSIGMRGKNFAVVPQAKWTPSALPWWMPSIDLSVPILFGDGKRGAGVGVNLGVTFTPGHLPLEKKDTDGDFIYSDTAVPTLKFESTLSP